MAVNRGSVPTAAGAPQQPVEGQYGSHHQQYNVQHEQQHYQVTQHHQHGGGTSIPEWFEVGSFQYNMRVLLGFSPGIILLGAVLGKTFFAVLLFCSMVILFLKSMNYLMSTLVATVCTILVCQITNFYLMVPLVWHSVINLPMYLLLHLFIAVAGTWGLLQNEEFLKQDPRIILLVEKGLFILIPGLDLAMVGWVSGMLWGKEYLPLVLAITGISICSLYLVPLQSSFAKQRTPQHTGLIMSQPIAIAYMVLMVFLPGILNASLNHSLIFSSVEALVKYQTYFVGPLFVLTLLEAQGIFYWLGSSVPPRIMHITRLVTGGFLMILLFYLVKATPSSSYLPSLAVVLLFFMLALTTSLDNEHAHPPLISVVLSGVISVLFFVSSMEIRWNLSYTFSLFSIPYFVVQLLLLVLGLTSVGLLLGWRKDLTFFWPTYHAIFVGCEFILHKEELYSLPMLLSTTVAAVLLCLRLHRVGRLPLPITIMCIVVHVVKVFQFLPFTVIAPVSTTSYLSMLSMAGIILTGIGSVKLTSSTKHSLLMFISCCVCIIVGLCLCVDNFVSPVLSAVTHTPPSGADLAAVVILCSGYLIQQNISTVSHSKYFSSMAKVPTSFFMLGMIVWVLQVEFNVFEIAKSIAMIAIHHADVRSFMGRILTTEELTLMAWLTLVKWFVVIYAGLSMAMVILSDVITIIPVFSAIWLLGTGIGMLALIILAHHSPVSILGLLYVVFGSTVTVMMGTVIYEHIIKKTFCIMVSMFCLVLAVVGIVLSWEWSMPLVAEFVHIPSALYFILGFISLALTMKIVSLSNRGVPSNPVMCNISCLIAFLLAVLFPLPFKLDHTLLVSLSSCVMLLAQPDGYLIPKRQGLFLAPSMLLSSLSLFIAIFVDSVTHNKISPGYAIQLVCLLASVPGQVKLITCLWRDVPMRFSLVSFMLYVAPNALMAQFGGNPNVVYGSTAVLCFSLLMMGEFQTLKTI